MGSHISSNSWGYTSPNVADRAVLEAISYATSREVLVVFAAGNSNSNQAFYPAFSNEVVAVAATDNTGAAALLYPITDRGWILPRLVSVLPRLDCRRLNPG